MNTKRLFVCCGIWLLLGLKAASAKDSIGMTFVRIQSMEYIRGFDTDQQRERLFDRQHPFSNAQDLRYEKPSHRVNISKAFDIGQTEVTVGQFRQFVEATGYVTEAEKGDGALGFFPEEKDYVDRFHQDPMITWRTPGFEQTDRHPVVCVTWKDSTAFCAWLSEKERMVYRLPTEAEWELACRAGTKTWYAWGSDPKEAYSHANVADASLEEAFPNTTRYQRAVQLEKGDGDGYVFTAPAGKFKPNAWGIHDMHGNVWEWCQDRWSEDVYERIFDGIPRQERDQVLLTDPLFEDKTDQHAFGDWRVLRGGAWTCAPAAVRSTIRTYAESGDASIYTGFRVVRETSGPE